MVSAVDDLKQRARILHKQAKAGDANALQRIGSIAEPLQRRHALAAVARECGFASWPHAVAVLTGASTEDFGTLLYPDRSDMYWNVWSASYDEARKIREQHGGYLLAYKKHFFIADAHFVAHIGLDPADADWEKIGRDWVQPRDRDARERLYAKLVRQRAIYLV